MMISIETLFFAAVLNGVVLVLILSFNAYPRANRSANLLLAGLIALLTITMWNMFVLRAGLGPAMMVLDYLIWFTPLLWAPVVYLYVGQLTRMRPATPRRIATHSSIAIFFGFIQIPLYILRTHPVFDRLSEIATMGSVGLLYPQIAIYAFLSLQLLRRYRASLEGQLSALQKVNLKWLHAIIAVFTVFCAIDGVFNIPSVFLGTARPVFYDLVIVAEGLSVFAIGFFALRQPELVLGFELRAEPASAEPEAEAEPAPEPEPDAEPEPEPEPEPEKYIGSPIDRSLGDEMANRLDQQMEEERTFLSNELTLAELAQQAGMTPHHLSQVINQFRGQNFYDYVNAYRAHYAAEQLRLHGKTNLTRLSFASGFNNRASFNKAFKKVIGCTPSQYLDKQSAGQEAS